MQVGLPLPVQTKKKKKLPNKYLLNYFCIVKLNQLDPKVLIGSPVPFNLTIY